MKTSNTLKDIAEIKKEVDNAFDKVFSGNNRINEGLTDNHCNEETLKYFSGLYNGEEDSFKRKLEILKKLETLDMDKIEANIAKIINE